jgi:sensor histidine kinase YesM
MSWPKRIAVVVGVNTAGALIPAVFFLLFRPERGVEGALVQFRYGCVYSFTIGTLAFLVMDVIANRFRTLPWPLRILALGGVFVALAVVGSLVATLLFVLFGFLRPEQCIPQFWIGLRIAIGITLGIGGLVSLYESLSHRLRHATLEARTRQLAEERALKLASEARLSSLESRIHPHFLFNTLNSISALIREDPARAERTVERLAALLRYSLDANTCRLAPLRQEVRIVQDYLEIERTRFGDRLRYSIDVPPGAEDLEVPPMALQTLVENSVKHAVAVNRAGGEIQVRARLAPDRLMLEVADDGPGFELSALKPGHGLDSLQERLAALFPGQGRLRVERRNGRTVVGVEAPQKKVLV